MNALLNQRIRRSMIRGNSPDPFIAPFAPHLDGVKPTLNLAVGPYNSMALDKALNLYSTGRINFEQFLKTFTPTFVANCDRYMLLTGRVRSNWPTTTTSSISISAAPAAGSQSPTPAQPGRVLRC